MLIIIICPLLIPFVCIQNHICSEDGSESAANTPLNIATSSQNKPSNSHNFQLNNATNGDMHNPLTGNGVADEKTDTEAAETPLNGYARTNGAITNGHILLSTKL